jgi:hypothetical protein
MGLPEDTDFPRPTLAFKKEVGKELQLQARGGTTQDLATQCSCPFPGVYSCFRLTVSLSKTWSPGLLFFMNSCRFSNT